MRKLSALLLSFAVIYGITLISGTDNGKVDKRSMTYSGINNEALRTLSAEILKAQSNHQIDLSAIVKQIENLKVNKTVMYEAHAHQEAPQTASMILLYLGGLLIGVVGFASFSRNKTVDAANLNGTMKRVLKDVNYPIFVCDSNFEVSWQNDEAQRLDLGSLNISLAMENYRTDSTTYSIKIEELKYKSGKTNYVFQMIPQTLSPNLFSNIVNDEEIGKVLERSINESKDSRDLNDLVAENTVKMNSLLKASAKLIDVDLDENLSECFIESGRLNEAVREFMLANYNLIKDDANISGLYLRTSERGQRFNLNCFIPDINKEDFATGEASRIFVQNLAGLESKFNLYQPRVSFRWINEGETKGVDICLSVENKSELESTLRESNA